MSRGVIRKTSWLSRDWSSAAQKRKVEKVMHEYEKADLKNSSGRKVKSRKQAVAIAMSESGQSQKRKNAS